jgi:Holliday junction resolvase
VINSRQKGASFEREVAKALTAEGFPAKRGAQVSQGSWGISAPDVIVPCLPDFHFECKRHGRARFDLDAAVDQARHDAGYFYGGSRKIAVIHRKDHCDMLVTMPFEDFAALVRHSDFPIQPKTPNPHTQNE